MLIIFFDALYLFDEYNSEPTLIGFEQNRFGNFQNGFDFYRGFFTKKDGKIGIVRIKLGMV